MGQDTEQALRNEFDIDDAAKLMPEEVVESKYSHENQSDAIVY